MKTVALILLSFLGPTALYAQTSSRELDQVARLLSENGRRPASRTTRLALASLQPGTQAGKVPGRALYEQALLETDISRAVTLLEKSAELDPRQHRLVGWRYFTAYRDYDRALQHLDAFDALTPDFDDTDGIAPVSYLKGLCFRSRGNQAEAIAQFSKGIDSLARKHGTEWVNYKHYVSRAISFLALNQPEKALLDLERARKSSASPSPLVLYHLGWVFQEKGQLLRAKQCFSDALFFWQARRVKGFPLPEDPINPLSEADIEEALRDLPANDGQPE